MPIGEISRAIFAAIETNDLDSAAGYLSGDFVCSGYGPEPMSGKQWLELHRALLYAFPDWSFNLGSVEVSGNVAHVSFQCTGIQTGSLDLSTVGLPIVPATLRIVKLPIEHAELAFDQGKAVRLRVDATSDGNLLELLRQLGVVAMTSTAERIICSSLRSILEPMQIGANFDDSEELRAVLSALEYYLPEVLSDDYSSWIGDSLDGVFANVARKTGGNKAEFAGTFILLSDEFHRPFHLRLRISETSDEIIWLECRLGESGDGRGDVVAGVSRRWDPSEVIANPDSFNWAYTTSFGAEEPPIGDH